MTLPDMLTQNGWQLNRDHTQIHKTFRFKNFQQAMSFMLQVSYEAERLDHHPDWSNTYNRVAVTLTTHDQKALTDKDIKLAESMERCANQPLLAA